MSTMEQHINPNSPSAAGRYSGKVVYVFAYDIAYDMKRLPVKELLGQPVVSFGMDHSKREPKEPLFFRPQMVNLPPTERMSDSGAVRLERTVKMFPVGSVSITVNVPFSVETLEELVGYHNLLLSQGTLSSEVRQLAEETRTQLADFCIRPVEELQEDEAYTVFCLESPPAGAESFNAEAWLGKHRREIAAILTEEPNAALLSQQEVEESTGLQLSYYGHDLVVADWDAALVIDEPANFNNILHIMELANVQLAELGVYDQYLDAALSRSYQDLHRTGWRRHLETMQRLREIRVDLARLNDELSNATKFFGDWHLARVYQSVSRRFHLDDWQRIISDKLRTLDGLYQILKQDQVNRWMLVLEIAIVLLFIIDLIILLIGLR